MNIFNRTKLHLKIINMVNFKLNLNFMVFFKFKRKKIPRDFSGGPVVKTPRSQCRRPGFSPWLGN